MINIEILFFGKLKEIWGTKQIHMQTDCQTIESLYQELLKKLPEQPHKDSIKVAINDEFASWNSAIHENDSIAFLPPASGG
ncbi:MAG TPA: hypothetical protein ENJ41_05135 [Oceanospirillales bacterium]|nr:hypothetical protein [Oceanospirillales bacterium]